MTIALEKDITFATEGEEWAQGWVKKKTEYIHHAARFSSPLTSRIARFVLEIDGKEEQKKEG
jgi:hypothetical protein